MPVCGLGVSLVMSMAETVADIASLDRMGMTPTMMTRSMSVEQVERPPTADDVPAMMRASQAMVSRYVRVLNVLRRRPRPRLRLSLRRRPPGGRRTAMIMGCCCHP
ncbi:Uncharacterised protein [Mycobacteroides abscessus subsp. abscessus]|nr:Uncharacterised protein [Mycobacteroides abscessus subsp. abscessus]